MRRYTVIPLLAVLSALGACGGASGATSLPEYVNEAMAELPYEHRMLPKLRSDDYVVFKMVDSRTKAAVTIAFGLPSKTTTCSKPSRPARLRKGFQPFYGAAGVPLICFASDDWRPTDSQEASITRANMSNLVATKLCEAVYDKKEFEDFVCFD